MDDALIPGTDAYAEAWRLYPDRIARRLTPQERYDPEKNPLHPLASSEPPGQPLRQQLPIDRNAWAPRRLKTR